MGQQQARDQKLIFAAMSIVVVAAFVERFSGVKQTASVEEIVAGAFIATALLILLSYVSSEFAVGLATVAAVTMIVAKGDPFWTAIGHITGSNKKTGSKASTPSQPSQPV